MPCSAQFIIVLSHVILVWLSVWIGWELLDLDIKLPQYLGYAFVGLFLFAAITYPSRHTRHSDPGYFFKQKFRDCVLAAATVGMVISVANNPDGLFSSWQTAQAAVINPVENKNEKPTAAQILESLKTRDKSSLTRIEKKILRQEFKKQLKVYVVATVKGDKEAQKSTGLIILAIVAAIGLLLLVGALACSISCNGSTGAAIVVGILGAGLVILGLIAVIRSINKKKNKPATEPEPPQT